MDQFKKDMAFHEGNKVCACNFFASLDETNADIGQLTKKWNCKLIF